MKLGAESISQGRQGIFDILLGCFKSPYVIVGFGSAAIAAVLWVYALSRISFSSAYFTSSVSYIFIILISIFVFKETISPAKWVGCGLIVSGVLLVVRSS